MHGISTAGSLFMDSESRQIAESDELQSQVDRVSTMSKLVSLLNEYQTSGTSGEERKKQAATRGARTLRLQPVPANTEVFDIKILTSRPPQFPADLPACVRIHGRLPTQSPKSKQRVY
eukprot:810601-Prymnesium_polylepis.1